MSCSWRFHMCDVTHSNVWPGFLQEGEGEQLGEIFTALTARTSRSGEPYISLYVHKWAPLPMTLQKILRYPQKEPYINSQKSPVSLCTSEKRRATHFTAFHFTLPSLLERHGQVSQISLFMSENETPYIFVPKSPLYSQKNPAHPHKSRTPYIFCQRALYIFYSTLHILKKLCFSLCIWERDAETWGNLYGPHCANVFSRSVRCTLGFLWHACTHKRNFGSL